MLGPVLVRILYNLIYANVDSGVFLWTNHLHPLNYRENGKGHVILVEKYRNGTSKRYIFLVLFQRFASLFFY